MKHFLAILLFLTTATSYSQTNEIGLILGAANFKGDLNRDAGAKESKPVIGLFARHHYHRHFALRGSFLYGNLNGSDTHLSYSSDDRRERGRGLSFSSHIWELAVVNEFYLIDKSHKNEFSAYIFAGGGIMHFNPTATYKGTQYHLRDYHTEGQGQAGHDKEYKLTTLTGLIGLGGKYQFSSSMCLGLELGYRFTNSDYIDDVHGNYADPSEMEGDKTRIALADRSFENADPQYYGGTFYLDSFGNPHLNGYGKSTDKRGSNKTNDKYLILNLSISYVFKNKPGHGFSESQL
jgi:hypothetical protein